MPLPKLKFDLVKALLLFSLAFFSLAYGMTAVHYQIFPYSIARDAKGAFEALAEVFAGDLLEDVPEYKDQVTEPTVRDYSEAHGNELILVCGGKGYLKTENEDGCLAWLMDRQGKVKHIWKYDPDTWKDLEHVSRVFGKSSVDPVDMHLYEDGGLLVNFDGDNCFPFAIGMARYDRDSNLIWKKELLTHHWFSIAEDGRIFVPALRVVDSPIPVGKTRVQIHSHKQKIYSDTILILDPDGNVLDEISMLDALFDSGWDGLLQTKEDFIDETDDPLHLNDVRLASAEFAESFSWLDPGDLLVSFRNINAVGILDPETRRFKWMVAGRTMRQHSPRYYDNGVLIFDNQGGDIELGGTRLAHVDLNNSAVKTLFPLAADLMPDKCFAMDRGFLDINRDGKRLLMALNQQGVIWEVDLDQAKVLWEYIYVHPQESGARQQMKTAKYVYNATFPFNREGENH